MGEASLKAFNFQAWIDAHREQLKPPEVVTQLHQP